MKRRWALLGLGALLLLVSSVGCWDWCTGPQILIVVITSPDDGDFFEVGETITFTVEARTQAGNTPQDAVYEWNSDQDGEICTADTFTTNTLSIGVHEITVAATDSRGSSGTASITITVTALTATFVSDPDIIGTWYSIDFVEHIGDFDPDPSSWRSDLFLEEIEFFAGGTTSVSWFGWTKNWILHENGETKAAYVIQQLGGKPYLFLPWLSGDVTISGQDPKYYVLTDAPPTSPPDPAARMTEYTLPPGTQPTDIVAMALDTSGLVGAWYDDSRFSMGTTVDLDAAYWPLTYSVPKREIIAMGIAENDHVHAWYSDGTFSSGTSWDLDAYSSPASFTLPPGKGLADIVGIGMAYDGILVSFFDDGTARVGTASDLGAGLSTTYSIPPYLDTDSIVGVAYDFTDSGFAAPFIYWYEDRTWARGGFDSEPLDYGYSYLTPSGKDPSAIRGMGVATSGYAYAWYADGTATAGSRSDLDSARTPYGYSFPEEIPGQVIGMAIGVGSMVYTWFSNGIVYAGNGAEPAADWREFAPSPYTLPPGKALNDIVGMGINSGGAVYTWYDDGTATAGTTTDLDAYRTPYAYTLSAGKTPADVVGMAIDKANDHCYAWYDDGTVSAGSSSNLDLYEP